MSHNGRYLCCFQLLFEAQQFEFQIENFPFLVLLNILLTVIEVDDALLTNHNIKPNLIIKLVLTEFTDFVKKLLFETDWGP